MEGGKMQQTKGITSSVWFAIFYYAAISSTMLVINKAAIHLIHAPTLILMCQLCTSALFAYAGGRIGFLDTDAMEVEKLKKFLLVVVGFLGTIYANIKVLQNSNVETFITFRSSTPLLLSLCDFIFLGRSLPNCRSFICLIVMLAGAAGYVMVDSAFKIEAYLWLVVWYAFFTFDTVYVKYMCESVKMTNWGRVYYTNGLAIAPLMLIFPATSDYTTLQAPEIWSTTAVMVLALSCLAGIWMSHASYVLRDAVSATSFTIVGIVCKLLTVAINCLIWDYHASPAGIGFLLLCVLAGSLYQQAPKRPEASSETQPLVEVKTDTSSEGSKEMQQPLATK